MAAPQKPINKYPHVIYRGPVEREPETVNLKVATALTPGVAVTITGGKLAALANTKGRVLILSNRRFYGQTIDGAYEADETAVAYRVEGEQEYAVKATAADYVLGDPMTIGANGVWAKASKTGDVVVAFCDKAVSSADVTAGCYVDIVIASLPYTL